LHFRPPHKAGENVNKRYKVLKVIYRDQSWEFDRAMTVKQIVQQTGLLPGTVLALRNGKLITEDQMVYPQEEIKLVAIVSGG